MNAEIDQKRREDCEDAYCESISLLPCPFCGSEARFVNTHDGGVCVECAKCMASSRAIYPSKEDPKRELSEQWNTRNQSGQYDAGYQQFVGEMAKHCHCEYPHPCPCDGVLAGGLCDELGHEPDFSKDDDESEDE